MKKQLNKKKKNPLVSGGGGVPNPWVADAVIPPKLAHPIVLQQRALPRHVQGAVAPQELPHEVVT